jgi:hypothetical protein
VYFYTLCDAHAGEKTIRSRGYSKEFNLNITLHKNHDPSIIRGYHEIIRYFLLYLEYSGGVQVKKYLIPRAIPPKMMPESGNPILF